MLGVGNMDGLVKWVWIWFGGWRVDVGELENGIGMEWMGKVGGVECKLF